MHNESANKEDEAILDEQIFESEDEGTHPKIEEDPDEYADTPLLQYNRMSSREEKSEPGSILNFIGYIINS